MKDAALYIIAAAALWNLAAFATVVHDKAAARRNARLEPEQRARRTPEKTFLMFAAAFGGVGVLIGFYAVRHKTLHRKLLFGVWALTLAGLAALAALWYLAAGRSGGFR